MSYQATNFLKSNCIINKLILKGAEHRYSQFQDNLDF